LLGAFTIGATTHKVRQCPTRRTIHRLRRAPDLPCCARARQLYPPSRNPEL